MERPHATPDNPRRLTHRELLTIEYAVKDSDRTGKIDIHNAVRKIGKPNKTKRSVIALVGKKLASPDFRAELIEQLIKKNILGANGKVEQVLVEGLDAVKIKRDSRTGEIIDEEKDFDARLKYAQELNKITGVYA